MLYRNLQYTQTFTNIAKLFNKKKHNMQRH